MGGPFFDAQPLEGQGLCPSCPVLMPDVENRSMSLVLEPHRARHMPDHLASGSTELLVHLARASRSTFESAHSVTSPRFARALRKQKFSVRQSSF
jgi:hypothetical protein